MSLQLLFFELNRRLFSFYCLHKFFNAFISLLNYFINLLIQIYTLLALVLLSFVFISGLECCDSAS